MEPLGKTWALSYIEQIKLKKLKDRRLYAVKALEDRLHCFDKKDTRNCSVLFFDFCYKKTVKPSTE